MSPIHISQIKSLVSSFETPSFEDYKAQPIGYGEYIRPLKISIDLFNRVILTGEYYHVNSIKISEEIHTVVYNLKTLINSIGKSHDRECESLLGQQDRVSSDLFRISMLIDEKLEEEDRKFFYSVEDILTATESQYTEDPRFKQKKSEYALIKESLKFAHDYKELLERLLEPLSVIEANVKLFKDIATRLSDVLDQQANNNFDYSYEFMDFIIDDAKHSIEKTKFDNNQSELATSVLKINIAVAYLDEILECNEKTKFNLNYFKDFLQSPLAITIFKEVVDLLLDKIEFLLYKIYFRTSKNKLNGAAEPPNINCKFYGGFEKLLTNHYKRQFTRNFILEKLNFYTGESISHVDASDIHNLVWYLKNREVENWSWRVEKIKILQRNLQGYIEGVELEAFDKIALQTALTFCENAIFELILKEEEDNNFQQLISDYENILLGKTKSASAKKYFEERIEAIKLITLSDSTNFYIYYTFTKFINKFIEYIKTNPNSLFITFEDYEKEEKIEKIDVMVNRVVNDLKGVISWSLDGLRRSLGYAAKVELMPFYLTFKECCVAYRWQTKLGYDHEDDEVILFLNSAYILPNDLERILKQYANWEVAMSSVDIQIVHQKLLFEQQKILLSIRDKSFQLRLKETEFKSIQIITIFVSVSVFALTSSKMIGSENSAMENYGLLLGFAGGLMLFNAGINFLVQWNLYRFRYDAKQMVISVVLLIAILFCLNRSRAILVDEGSRKLKKENNSKESQKTSSMPYNSLFYFYCDH